MRPLVALLLALPAAAEDLTLRDGSGWAGFKPGTWVRVKRTPVQMGRMLTPTITRTTLVKADARALTLESVSENALGMRTEDRQVVPLSGEAGPGETEKVEELEGEVVAVGERRLDCICVRSTVSGPPGRRVITKWIAREPRVWAKRTEVVYGPEGNVISRTTLTLASLHEERGVGGRKLSCLVYRTQRLDGDVETSGVAYMSRDVPGSLVWMETETRQGAGVVTLRAELLDFESK